MARRYNDPSDELRGLSSPLANATLLDFWKWAYPDLCDDDVKGIFAEWIVAKLLKSEDPRRISWANSDLITKGGTRIEVKATAYWQSYKLIDEAGRPREVKDQLRPESKITFAGLRAGDATGDQTEREVGFKSDLYVFAFQKQTDPNLWDAMDLAQWEFFVVGREELKHNSITLSKLRSHFGPSLAADELQHTLITRIEKLEEALPDKEA